MRSKQQQQQIACSMRTQGVRLCDAQCVTASCSARQQVGQHRFARLMFAVLIAGAAAYNLFAVPHGHRIARHRIARLRSAVPVGFEQTEVRPLLQMVPQTGPSLNRR